MTNMQTRINSWATGVNKGNVNGLALLRDTFEHMAQNDGEWSMIAHMITKAPSPAHKSNILKVVRGVYPGVKVAKVDEPKKGQPHVKLSFKKATLSNSGKAALDGMVNEKVSILSKKVSEAFAKETEQKEKTQDQIRERFQKYAEKFAKDNGLSKAALKAMLDAIEA